MARQRGDGEGSLRKIKHQGQTVWHARFILWRDGKRSRPERIIGTVAEYPTKADARERLNEIIREETGKIKAEALTRTATFAEVWQRFRELNLPHWSRPHRETLDALFNRALIPQIGEYPIASLDREILQRALNHMVDMPVGRKKGGQGAPARIGYSESLLEKAVANIRRVVRFAIDDLELMAKDPSTKLKRPPARREPCERFLTLDEVQRLFAVAQGRESITLRIFLLLGLRPAEVLALKPEDIGDGTLRIDEAIKERELVDSPHRIGPTKTRTSKSTITVPPLLMDDLRAWAATVPAGQVLFPRRNGKTWRVSHYLQRILKPLAASVGIPDLTDQAMRRTFATHFSGHAQNIKDTQMMTRHAKPDVLLKHYQKSIPESVVAAATAWEREAMGLDAVVTTTGPVN